MKCAGRCSVSPKVTRAVRSATHADSWPRSGMSAIRSAPASGTSRIHVRIVSLIALMFSPSRPLDVDPVGTKEPGDHYEEQHGGRARGQPRCIRTKIARLPALQQGTAKVRRACEQPRRTTENGELHDPLEHEPRDGQNRLHDHRAIELVDPILVREDG